MSSTARHTFLKHYDKASLLWNHHWLPTTYRIMSNLDSCLLRGNPGILPFKGTDCWESWVREQVIWRESESRSVVSDSSQPHGLYSPWNSPGQNTGMVAFPFSGGSSQPRYWTTGVSRIGGGFFTSWTTRKVLWREGLAKNISLQQEKIRCPLWVSVEDLLHFA